MVIRQSSRTRRKPIRIRPTIQPNLNRRTKREQGYYLVEALVCCLIIGIISAGLADGYAKIKSFNVHSQTELQAVGIAQECIDQLRSQQFNWLLANGMGTHNVPVVGSTSGGTGDAVFTRPLLRDTDMTYYGPSQIHYIATNYAVSDAQNYLQVSGPPAGTVQVTLTAAQNSTLININVVVNWIDGTGPHTYTCDTSLAGYGLNG